MSKNIKIIIGIVVILAVCGFVAGFAILGMSGLYLASSASQSSAQYFLTVNEVLSKDSTVNKQIRISGAVVGDSIEFDQASGKLSFQIAHVPVDYAEIEKQGGLVIVLENAVNDPNHQRIQVVYVGEKPELLRNMAQAIIIGELHSDGIFYADEILLKCPSRYEEAIPDQTTK
ncbi:MAG: cytochrome c maturation protein CcmE [Chloroflexi bacterium]|nr:cytochrome c maturation protein CcmE [Chloroflexota bacterium]